jgi:signal transduction histidine kinase
VITAVDPSLVIAQVLKERAEEMSERRASVRVMPGLPLVACHRAYLRQVFDNLISNALKFSRPGEPPSIQISAEAREHMVCISVADGGIGIPLAQRRRVFSPFVRLLMSPAPGNGIGLTIVQRIVELYGGHVWIDGEDGEGCTVRFTLPCFGSAADVSSTVARASDHPEVIDGSERGFL